MIRRSKMLFLTIFSIISLSGMLKSQTVHSVCADELSSKLIEISHNKSSEAPYITIVDIESLFDVKNDTKAHLVLKKVNEDPALCIGYFLMKGRKILSSIFDTIDNEIICIESSQKFLRLITHKILTILNQTKNISIITHFEALDLINILKNQKRSVIFIGKGECIITEALKNAETDNASTVDIIIVKDDKEQDSETL